MKVEVGALGCMSLTVLMVSVDVKQPRNSTRVRAQGLCESRGGRPGLHVSNSPYGLCGRKTTLNSTRVRAQGLCESRGGRPGLPFIFQVLRNVLGCRLTY